MGIKVKFDGFDKLEKELNKLERKAKELSGTRKVSFADLFTPEFMRENTRFSSLDELFKAANLNIASSQDFEDLPQEELDAGIRSVTRFKSWDDFIGEAGKHYAIKKLGF